MVKRLIFPRLSTSPQVEFVWNRDIISEWFKMPNSEATVTISDSVRDVLSLAFYSLHSRLRSLFSVADRRNNIMHPYCAILR
jgi:hypothetical protein